MMDKGGDSLAGRKIEEYLANEGIIDPSFLFLSMPSPAQNTLSDW